MEKIVTLFSGAVIAMFVFSFAVWILFQKQDAGGYEGVLETAGSSMAVWKENSRMGYEAYLEECMELFPKAEFLHQSLTIGTYSAAQLFCAYDSTGNEAGIKLCKLIKPNGQEIELSDNQVTFDNSGVYSLQFEVRDSDRRVCTQYIKIPVNR